jgi:hypothetical protein
MLPAARSRGGGFGFSEGKVNTMRKNLSLVLAGSLLLGTAWMTGCKDKDTSKSAANEAQTAADKASKGAENAQKQESAATQKGENEAADMAKKGKEEMNKAHDEAAKAQQDLKNATDTAKQGADTNKTPDNK